MESGAGDGDGAPGQGGGATGGGGGARGLAGILAQAAAAAAAGSDSASQARSGAAGGAMSVQGQGQGDQLPAAAVAALAGSRGGETTSNVSAPMVRSGGTPGGMAAAIVARVSRGGVARDVAGTSDESGATQRRIAAAAAGIAAATGSRQGGAPGAAAVQRSPQYDASRVEYYVERRMWGSLERYLIGFIQRAGHNPRHHPRLLLHCRRGLLIDMIEQRSRETNMFYMANIAGDALRNVRTPYADSYLTSGVDTIQAAMVRGAPIEEDEDLAAKINDYMLFYFPHIVGHLWQGKNAFWRFALKLGRQPSRHPIFRCLLCQEVFDKGSLQIKMQKHLNGGGCRGMTAHAMGLLREIEKSMFIEETKDSSQKNMESAHKRSASTMAISEDHSKPSKVICTITSKIPAQQETRVADGSGTERMMADLGYALLESLSSLISQEFSDQLATSLDIINGTTSAVIRWQEAMKARGVILDIILSTDVPKEMCSELSNYFDTIIFHSLHQPPLPPDQPNAQPTQLEQLQNSDPTVLFNIHKGNLHVSVTSADMQPGISMSAHPEASTSTQQRQKIVIEAPPSPYDDFWDNIEQGDDAEPEGQEKSP